jgi:hypothetical protein
MRVRMIDTEAEGVIVPCPDWSLNTELLHIVWDGSDYVTVYQPEEVEVLDGRGR